MEEVGETYGHSISTVVDRRPDAHVTRRKTYEREERRHTFVGSLNGGTYIAVQACLVIPFDQKKH